MHVPLLNQRDVIDLRDGQDLVYIQVWTTAQQAWIVVWYEMWAS